ncbi:MAG: helix-turn-helix transcriptional regulator [Ectothiorhodospiraceae bacterium]|nr:helix-turn-helix transcriptional regulator [Ectothiorhodospiraceae bacterium]MCH8504482.1 helix-turn-helix transcriptional regulator [Ectothiorhodospiraceae bacterium]
MDNLTTLRATENARNDVLDAVYRTAVDPAYWSDLLADLVRISASRSARMLLMDGAAETVRHSAKHQIDDKSHADYTNYFVNLCPWRTELPSKPTGRLYSTYLDFSCDQKAFYGTEFFNDWAGPIDIHHGVCGTVYQSDQMTMQLLVQRTRGQGPYGRRETAWFNDLIPHIRRSLFLSREVALQRAEEEAAAMAASRSPLPFMLLGRDGRICRMSQELEPLTGPEGVFGCREGRLFLRKGVHPGKLRRELDQMLAVNDDSRSADGGGVFRVPREGGRAPLQLLLLPLMVTWAGMLFEEERAYVAIFVHDPERMPALNEPLLVKLYGLTEAEARVAAGVTLGNSPEELAATMNVSVHTVRSQLKSVFRKTGTSRQNALARLLLTGPAVQYGTPFADQA